MSNILYHAAVKDWRITFAENLSFGLVSIKRTIRQYLHDLPKLLHIFLALGFRDPVGDNNKSFLAKMLSPCLLVFKVESIIVLAFHY
jgi:hypothetical protein